MSISDHVETFVAQNRLPFTQGMEEATRLGFSAFYVDVATEADAVETFDNGKCNRLIELCKLAHLRPIVHGTFRSPIAHDLARVRRGAIEHVLTELELAARIKAPLIVHGCYMISNSGVRNAKEHALQTFLESLSVIAEQAARLGVTIWIENLEKYPAGSSVFSTISSVKEYAEIFKRMPAHVKFLLDVGHENVQGGDPHNTFRLLASRIAALSLNDNDGHRDLHLPIGKGNIDFAKLVDAIQAVNWRGIVIFETTGDVGENVRQIEALFSRA